MTQDIEFADAETTLAGRNGPVRVRVTSDALHTMWGENTGPQTADGLIEANSDMLTQIAEEKVAAGISDGVIVITGMDIEG